MERQTITEIVNHSRSTAFWNGQQNFNNGVEVGKGAGEAYIDFTFLGKKLSF